MWGLMPAKGSDVTISNSKIRSVGLWFEGKDSINVNGFVDNSTYSNFTANLADRNLHFINTSVQTWSVYAFDTVNLNITGCILGEIGIMGRSKAQTNDIYVDGSGGYWWGTDTTLMIGAFSTAVNDVRSDRNAIFLFGYSTLNSGVASALSNSILMIVQSQLPQDPIPLDKSCVWYAYIGKPASSSVDTIVPVIGSAWIDKTPTSLLMDFAYYQMFYQKSGDTVWHQANKKSFIEKRNDTLVAWNTHGLMAGAYNLKLILCDNTNDSNKVEAVKSINLLPAILNNIEEQTLSTFNSSVFPNPSHENAIVSFNLQNKSEVIFSIVDVYGRKISCISRSCERGVNSIKIDNTNLSKGIYYYRIQTENNSESGKFIVN